MNKLLMKEQIEINENGAYVIELTSELKELHIQDNISCEVLFYGKNVASNLKIYIGENASLFCQNFFVDGSSVFEIYLEKYKASVDIVYSMIATKEETVKFVVHHNHKSTSSTFTNHIVNYSNYLTTIQVDAYVQKGIGDCILNQDNKIILIGKGKGKILPNLFIDDFTAFAKHSAYISKFSKDEIFYLKSRGIAEAEANFLLTKSLLFGKMKLDSMFLQKFTEVLQNIRR